MALPSQRGEQREQSETGSRASWALLAPTVSRPRDRARRHHVAAPAVTELAQPREPREAERERRGERDVDAGRRVAETGEDARSTIAHKVPVATSVRARRVSAGPAAEKPRNANATRPMMSPGTMSEHAESARTRWRRRRAWPSRRRFRRAARAAHARPRGPPRRAPMSSGGEARSRNGHSPTLPTITAPAPASTSAAVIATTRSKRSRSDMPLAMTRLRGSSQELAQRLAHLRVGLDLVVLAQDRHDVGVVHLGQRGVRGVAQRARSPGAAP